MSILFDENSVKVGEEQFGEGEEEGGIDSDRSNKRVKEMPIDRLSELPDLLLIHILSFLGVKEAGITSVLSKRWECLWAELPSLEFWENGGSEKTPDFVSWVNRTLGIRKSDYLEKFLVKFINYNECFDSDVDAWVEFAVKNEVKKLRLMLYSDDYYTPPQMLYSCSSLTSLYLTNSIMDSESTIGWQSLTSLSLDDVELNQRLIDEILSSCPVLKSFKLESCWGFNRLEVNSPCLDYLRVQECEDDYLEISAPYIHDLHIRIYPEERKCQLKNISSLVGAYIDFFESNGVYSEEEMSNAKDFLEKFTHVKKLCIAREFFEALSVMAVNGWQLPQFRLQKLTLISCSEYEHSISGIIFMLESSPNLETLLLEGYGTDGEIAHLEPGTKSDLDGDLLHLKKIRVNNFASPNGEPLLTLARILLRRAPALEEMMIVIDVEDKSDYVNIAQTLLTYPRSSTKAEIYMMSHKMILPFSF